MDSSDTSASTNRDPVDKSTTSSEANNTETPQEALECCITQLYAVHESDDSGWRSIVKGGDSAGNY
jgi:hypothetical protein